MSQEHELEDLTREQAGAVLYRLADGVAVGSVTIGERTIAVPDRLEVEIEVEDVEGERELEVDLEWPLSAEDEVDVESQDASGTELEVPEDEISGAGEDVDPAHVEDSPIEAASADEPGIRSTDDAPSPTSIVEPGELTEVGSDARFELFEDNAGEWRWRLVHDNGNVIADSGEGYSRKANAKKGLRSVQTNAPGAEIVEK